MRFLNLMFSVLVSLSVVAQTDSKKPDCSPPDHSDWSVLLQRYVNSDGWVGYKGFQKDSVELNRYLTQLSVCPPSGSWTTNEKLAYWINAYNAFTVKLIIDHYPVASIKDIKKGIPFINSVWEMDFFEIGGKSFDLSKIEHGILRKEFNEPRIHFAIVCASRSCPILLNKAYDPKTLEEQLEAQAKRFINDSSRNVLDKDEIQLSAIFKWFKKDFTQNRTLKDFINKYSEVDISSNAKVTYLDYDWNLNSQ